MHSQFAPRLTSAGTLALLILGTGLTLAAQAPPPATTPAPASTSAAADAQPEVQKERSYVRRFSLGVSVGLIPFNTFPKGTFIDKVTGPPVIERDASVDPKSNRVAFGFVAQLALTDRLAIAIAPTYNKFAFHGFIKSFVGVDNSATLIDERAESDINEDTTGHFIEIPALIRFYSKGRKEPGKRWYFEGGPNFRMTSKVQTARSIVPPKGDTVKDSIPLDYRKNTIGGTVGIGGQFIDDFGIRTIPEVRYTYWINKPFDSYHGQTRTHQIEIVLTFAF